jgi:hypothetical protein
MLHVPKGFAAGMVAGAVLLGGTGPAAAQATTTTTKAPTTTTSSTTTTLLPHPFSPATRACIEQAKAQRKVCRQGGGTNCSADFQAAYAMCFAAPSGEKCAMGCQSKESKCLGASPTTERNCKKACMKTYHTDFKNCRTLPDDGALWAGQDASCLSTASANLSLCQFTCAEADADCHTAFTNCIANCQNL